MYFRVRSSKDYERLEVMIMQQEYMTKQPDIVVDNLETGISYIYKVVELNPLLYVYACFDEKII